MVEAMEAAAVVVDMEVGQCAPAIILLIAAHHMVSLIIWQEKKYWAMYYAYYKLLSLHWRSSIKNMHGGYVKYSLTFGCVLRWEMVVKVTGHQHLRLHHIQKVQWIYHMRTLGRSSSQMHIVVKYLSCSRGVRIVRKSNLNPNPEWV